MLIPLDKLVSQRSLKWTVIVHVGANTGEEMDAYVAAGAKHITWIEPRQTAINELKQKIETLGDTVDQQVFRYAVDVEPDQLYMHIASNGAASSCLKPALHLEEHPSIFFVGGEVVSAKPLDELLDESHFNQRTIDLLKVNVQGMELRVLKSAIKSMDRIQSVYVEVNEKPLYFECVLFPELDAFVQSHGFRLIEKEMTTHGSGAAFYTRGD